MNIFYAKFDSRPLIIVITRSVPLDGTRLSLSDVDRVAHAVSGWMMATYTYAPNGIQDAPWQGLLFDPYSNKFYPSQSSPKRSSFLLISTRVQPIPDFSQSPVISSLGTKRLSGAQCCRCQRSKLRSNANLRNNGWRLYSYIFIRRTHVFEHGCVKTSMSLSR